MTDTANIIALAKGYESQKDYEGLLTFGRQLIEQGQYLGYFIALKVMTHKGASSTELQVFARDSKLQTFCLTGAEPKHIDFMAKVLAKAGYRFDGIYFTLASTLPTGSHGKLPKLLICVGYPASGKTTFSTHLCTYLGSKVVRINQDEMGRSEMESIFNQHIKGGETLIIDTCNLEKAKRAQWLSWSFGASAWCVFFDIPHDECRWRIQRRHDHPTVKNGLRMLDDLAGKLEPPSLEEGFQKLFRIQKETDLDWVLPELGVTVPIVIDLGPERIIKFVRTRHLLNLGSASRDDLVMSSAEQKRFLAFVIYCEEKVDGAGLGFSVTKDYKIRAQNRSHFVCSADSAQFEPLDKWVAKRTEDLIKVIEPEIEILYGEWLVACHSINYERLPDYFLVFDLYNLKTRTFLSRERLEERLKGTSLCQVPLLFKRKFESLDEIEALVKTTPSAFYNGLLEGLYFRICDETTGTTIDRAKGVRPDFISGTAQSQGANKGKVRHWSKNKLIRNKLANTSHPSS